MMLMRHPHILRGLALGEESGRPFMVVERLASVLEQQLPSDPATTPFWITWRQHRRWPLSRALRHGVELAVALRHCHDDAFEGYRLVHRDVKPSNIGFLPDGRLVLFDFGLAVLWPLSGEGTVDDEPCDVMGHKDSLRYQAPELADQMAPAVTTCDVHRHKADVFSFAIVLWEMAARLRPFASSMPETLPGAIRAGSRPPIPAAWPGELRLLLQECWSLDPQHRPEFRDVVPRLQGVLDSLSSTSKSPK